jgi:nicotinate-nucleotide adenylyltransferase
MPGSTALPDAGRCPRPWVVTIGVYPGSFDPLTVAHLAIADAARTHVGLERLDLAVSRRTLGKAHLDADSVERRVAALRRAVGDRPWLEVVVVDAQLVAEIARGYDVVVMGADKWLQVNDPRWYDDDPAARDAAVARLPRIVVAPRAELSVPAELRLPLPPHYAEVSATGVRAGRHEWAAPTEPERP